MIRKIELVSAALFLSLSLLALLFWNTRVFTAVLIGGLVSLTSFEISHIVLKRMLTKGNKKSIGRIVLFVVLKVGVVFGLIPYLILKLGVEPVGFLVGFSTVIASATILGIKGLKEVGDA